jgi:hypothetical protein
MGESSRAEPRRWLASGEIPGWPRVRSGNGIMNGKTRRVKRKGRKMKQSHIMAIMGSLGMLFAGLSGLADEGKADADGARVGVYDSRVVAYAHFWQDAHQREIKERVEAIKEAERSGDTNRATEVKAQMQAGQEQIHLQVFSTAPIDNVLHDIKDRVTAVKKEAGVVQLISKWDTEALKSYSRDQQVDVTDLLMAGFNLNEKQQKVAKSFEKQPPLVLEKAKQMLSEGKL